jgi:hypothetical protein
MQRSVLLLAGLLILTLLGCTPQPSLVEKAVDPTQQRLMLVGQAYRQFSREMRRPPRSAAELMPTLQQKEGGQDALQSARDGQPFVISWGLDVMAPRTGTERPVLAYEQQGFEGSRFVLSTMGNVELLPDGSFRESSFAPGFQPPQ